jgi:glycosyltransferase involved in cell wall biosynthesis
MNKDVLVLTRDRIGARMASPGIRMYNVARVLGERLQAKVTLAAPADSELPEGALPFEFCPYERSSVLAAARSATTLISNSYPSYLFPLMARRRVVLDLFSPFTERLEIAPSKGRDSESYFDSYRRELVAQLHLTDLVLCASPRQGDLYFGMLAALGRVRPAVYDRDRHLNDSIALAPFGVRDGEPISSERVLKGVWPWINEGDTVLIWNGVIIEWYDLETLLRAIATIGEKRSDVKLFFLGTEHPDSRGAPKLQGLGGGTTRMALRLSEELGILDRLVFFNFDWVDYQGTANYLLESDIGICTYYDNIETRFAFRSRYADLVWAGLPIICTRGDVWAEQVDRRPLGVAVPEKDVEALVRAILRLTDDRAFIEECKANLREERENRRWEREFRRLAEYCADPPALVSKLSELPAVAALMAGNRAASLNHAGLLAAVDGYHAFRDVVRRVQHRSRQDAATAGGAL